MLDAKILHAISSPSILLPYDLTFLAILSVSWEAALAELFPMSSDNPINQQARFDKLQTYHPEHRLHKVHPLYPTNKASHHPAQKAENPTQPEGFVKYYTPTEFSVFRVI